jgi:hypothetical protein
VILRDIVDVYVGDYAMVDPDLIAIIDGVNAVATAKKPLLAKWTGALFCTGGHSSARLVLGLIW